MRHARFHLARLVVADTEVPLRYATLVVVQRDGSNPDWELLVQPSHPYEAPAERSPVTLTALAAAPGGGLELIEMSGTAFWVRSVSGTVVWRGDGPLAGFDEEGFQP